MYKNLPELKLPLTCLSVNPFSGRVAMFHLFDDTYYGSIIYLCITTFLLSQH